MARFGRSYPMPHGGYFIAGAFGEEISQTVILESDESNQILPLTMSINTGVTFFLQDGSGSVITTSPAGFPMAMSLGTVGINIQQPVSVVVPTPIRITMSMAFRAATPETVSFDLPPGLWKRPKKKLPKKWAYKPLAPFPDTEYDIGIEFSHIVSSDGHWRVSSVTATSKVSDFRDGIFIRSEASISQDSSIEGRP